MRPLLVLMTLVVLTGCSAIQEQFSDVPKGVAVAQATLAAAEHTALIYVSFPVCGKTVAVLCRNPVITAEIKRADDIAYLTVQTAYEAKTQTSLQAAMTALNTLTSITDHLPVGGQ